MKRLIAITLILVAATAFITVKYFKNLTASAMHAGNIMRTIPDNAAAIFEFTNEKSFYDIFADNTLIGSIAGGNKLTDLDTVRKVLFDNPALDEIFTGSNIFVSVHPFAKGGPDLLLTASATKGLGITTFDRLTKEKKAGFVITPLAVGEKKGYTIFFLSLKKRFYIINKKANIFSASFSKTLIEQSAAYEDDKDSHPFLRLPDQQNLNSLANLYVNYGQLNALFGNLFKNNNPDMFKSFRLLPALAALNLNYKTDALMFNGYTSLLNNKPGSYLTLFAAQQPMENNLKEIFPSTTAYAIDLAVSDPVKFEADLNKFHFKAGLQDERKQLFSKIKTETGIDLQTEFTSLLSNEFAVINTRFQEKLAIITVKDGSKLRPFITNISGMLTDDIGQFNYSKLPFFLLGDAFNHFKRPYFRIIDNYLIMANSVKELQSYNDSYLNRKFLNNTEQYLRFDNLLADRSNVAFFIHFKNAQQTLKNELNSDVYDSYKNNNLSWKNFYAASYQFTAADKNFYTNFCMLLNPADTAVNVKFNKNPSKL